MVLINYLKGQLQIAFLCGDKAQESHTKALKEAEENLENCSYKEVANWVTNKTGRPITGMGLRKVLKRGW